MTTSCPLANNDFSQLLIAGSHRGWASWPRGPESRKTTLVTKESPSPFPVFLQGSLQFFPSPVFVGWPFFKSTIDPLNRFNGFFLQLNLAIRNGAARFLFQLVGLRFWLLRFHVTPSISHSIDCIRSQTRKTRWFLKERQSGSNFLSVSSALAGNAGSPRFFKSNSRTTTSDPGFQRLSHVKSPPLSVRSSPIE